MTTITPTLAVFRDDFYSIIDPDFSKRRELVWEWMMFVSVRGGNDPASRINELMPDLSEWRLSDTATIHFLYDALTELIGTQTNSAQENDLLEKYRESVLGTRSYWLEYFGDEFGWSFSFANIEFLRRNILLDQFLEQKLPEA